MLVGRKAPEFRMVTTKYPDTLDHEATLDEYEEVRADGATFMLAPGHEHADIERVVERKRGFHIVEKVQATVRATVRRLNPRAA